MSIIDYHHHRPCGTFIDVTTTSVKSVSAAVFEKKYKKLLKNARSYNADNMTKIYKKFVYVYMADYHAHHVEDVSLSGRVIYIAKVDEEFLVSSEVVMLYEYVDDLEI